MQLVNQLLGTWIGNQLMRNWFYNKLIDIQFSNLIHIWLIDISFGNWWLIKV